MSGIHTVAQCAQKLVALLTTIEQLSEKPSEYVIVPDKSPAPVFEIPTVADEEEPIGVAIKAISLELTAIIGVKGSGSTVTSSK